VKAQSGWTVVPGTLACLASASLLMGPSNAAYTPGLYTVAQARSGSHEYAAHCARCHGATLDGALGSPLRGDSFTSLGREGDLHIGEFFHFMITETPVGEGGSLSHRQYVEILAFVLYKNGYRSGPRPLTFDAALHSKELIAAQARHAAD
jgi:mono/diheme cytochrome c family protein